MEVRSGGGLLLTTFLPRRVWLGDLPTGIWAEVFVGNTFFGILLLPLRFPSRRALLLYV